ncbi:DUF4407 domain-containing protein [Microbacterium sp. H1-D42]|uniref:DUF4407 domain-containing protein n=1 Tax=Microbacterium sp. H1-D42 TaxID=2925844 RepID=UPI001F534B27|nr:DUF4407 domain-containing protein [Microbacterium sp. H1-D42]UNK71234.1 DUF4407 domain-containing protein [Microbacterium sp. H1-D42]
MSYSAHRPGRMDSQGRISFEADGPQGPDGQPGDDDLDFLRDYEPTGSTPPEADEHDTATRPHDVIGPDSGPVTEADASAAEPVASTGRQARPKRERMPRAERTPRPKRERIPGSRLRTLAILGGAEGEILDRVPGETPRFVQMFFVLLGTALVSAISMMFALTTGVQVAIWVAVPLALVWAAIIFNLDRFLTSTMTSTRSVFKMIALALPRVAMAALIGFLVAEPLVLQVFHNDIAREVASTNITQSQSDQEALESGPEKLALDAASDRVATLENQAATGIVDGTDAGSASTSAAKSTVDEITVKMADQQKVIDGARALYQCELTGEGAGTVPGCTGVNGQGSSSDAAKAQLAQAQQTYDALSAQLRSANDDLSAAETSAKQNTSSSEATNREQAKDQLPAAQQTYQQALAAYNARADSVASGNAQAVGLLSQITGLNRLAAKEPTIWWAHWLIAALFFMIELLPVLVKVLTSWGDPSLYEKAKAIRKQVDLDRVTADGFRDRAAIVAEHAAPRTGASAVGVSDAAASDPADAATRAIDTAPSDAGPPTEPVTRADLREPAGV